MLRGLSAERELNEAQSSLSFIAHSNFSVPVSSLPLKNQFIAPCTLVICFGDFCSRSEKIITTKPPTHHENPNQRKVTVCGSLSVLPVWLLSRLPLQGKPLRFLSSTLGGKSVLMNKLPVCDLNSTGYVLLRPNSRKHDGRF